MTRRTALRLAAIVAVLVAVVVVRVAGLGDALTDRQRFEDFLTDSGAVGPAAFILAFALSHPVGLPSVALTFVAGVVWPAPAAVALSWVGGMAGATVAFSFARWFGRAWVEERLPSRFRRFDEQLAKRAVTTVSLVRLLTYLPPPADWFFGVSRIRVREFLVGTAIGILPATVFIVVAGDQVTDWISTGGATAAAIGGGAAILSLVVLGLRRRRRRVVRASAPPGG